MNIRRFLNERPWISLVAVGMVVLVTLSVAVRSMDTRVKVVAGPVQMYYSDDDGKSYFADDSSRIPPFEHNGKPAYLAGVFRCQDAQPFVAYLIQYTPEGKAQLERFSPSARNSSDPAVNAVKLRTGEIRRPGEKRWIGRDDAEFDVYLAPACPSGSKRAPVELTPQQK